MWQSDHPNSIPLSREWQEKSVERKQLIGSREGLGSEESWKYSFSGGEVIYVGVIYCMFILSQPDRLSCIWQAMKTNKLNPFLNVSLLFGKFFYYLPPLQFFPKIYCPQYRIYKVSLSMSQNHAVLPADLAYSSETCQKEILSQRTRLDSSA